MYRCILKKCWRLNCLPTQIIRCISQNHYDVLGLKMDASQDEIKTAYKVLCKKLHPDVNREDPKTHEKFIRLKEAYIVLGKENTRKEYDRELMIYKHYGKNMGMSDYGDFNYRHGPGFERDPFYNYPKYEEVLWNRRHHPEKYSYDYDRSHQTLFFNGFTIMVVVFGALFFGIGTFYISSRRLRSQLDERDKRAARTWRELQRRRIEIAKTMETEGVEIPTNNS